MFHRSNDIVHYLPKICFKKFVGSTFQGLLNHYISDAWRCKEHNLFQMFIIKFVTFYIYTWTTNVNNILKCVDAKTKLLCKKKCYI